MLPTFACKMFRWLSVREEFMTMGVSCFKSREELVLRFRREC